MMMACHVLSLGLCLYTKLSDTLVGILSDRKNTNIWNTKEICCFKDATIRCDCTKAKGVDRANES